MWYPRLQKVILILPSPTKYSFFFQILKLPPPITETKNPQYSPFEYKVELPHDVSKPEVYIPNDYKVTTLNRDAHELIPVPVIHNDTQQPKLTQLSLSSQHYMNVGSIPAGINISGGGIVTNAPHIGDPIHGLNTHHAQPPNKRVKVWPSKTDQIMIYVRQDTETTYTALHLVNITRKLNWVYYLLIINIFCVKNIQWYNVFPI